MPLFVAAIATAQRLGALPKPLIYKPLADGTNFLGVTCTMDETEFSAGESKPGPYDFLKTLSELNSEIGVIPQTGLADQLGVTEGVVRGVAKAIAKVVPIERLKEDGKGKLTAQGVALVTACVQRGDTTLESWVHGLMQAMKAPEFKAIKGESSTADDIDLGFLDQKIENRKAQSTDLALVSQGELAALIRKSKELRSKSTEVTQQEKDRAYQSAYNRRIALLTEELKADIAAQQAFEEALAEGGLAPEI